MINFFPLDCMPAFLPAHLAHDYRLARRQMVEFNGSFYVLLIQRDCKRLALYRPHAPFLKFTIDMVPTLTARLTIPTGLRIRCWRILRRLTQGQLASMIDVHPSTVSRWERGCAEPDAIDADVALGFLDAQY